MNVLIHYIVMCCNSENTRNFSIFVHALHRYHAAIIHHVTKTHVDRPMVHSNPPSPKGVAITEKSRIRSNGLTLDIYRLKCPHPGSSRDGDCQGLQLIGGLRAGQSEATPASAACHTPSQCLEALILVMCCNGSLGQMADNACYCRDVRYYCAV